MFGVTCFKFLDRLQHYLTHILPLVRVDGTDCTWCTLRLILGGALPKYSASMQCSTLVMALLSAAAFGGPKGVQWMRQVLVPDSVKDGHGDKGSQITLRGSRG